jgi:hypothetical protein
MNSLKMQSESQGQLHYFLNQIYNNSQPIHFFLFLILTASAFIVYRIITDRSLILKTTT